MKSLLALVIIFRAEKFSDNISGGKPKCSVRKLYIKIFSNANKNSFIIRTLGNEATEFRRVPPQHNTKKHLQ